MVAGRFALAPIFLALLMVASACSDPLGDDDGEPNVTIAGRGSPEAADPVIVQDYLDDVAARDAMQTLGSQLALERFALGSELLRHSVPTLKTCATNGVQDDLEEFEQRLPHITPVVLPDDEFVGIYGYGIGLLSYYDLAIRAADPLLGEVEEQDAYAGCDLDELGDQSTVSEIAAIDAVLSMHSRLAVSDELQPELAQWRVCLDATPAGTGIIGYPGFEDLEMLTRATFDELSSDYFEVLKVLVATGATYDELLSGSAVLSADEALLASRLVELQALENVAAGYDQVCFEEHVAVTYQQVLGDELQRLQRDWPNL